MIVIVLVSRKASVCVRFIPTAAVSTKFASVRLGAGGPCTSTPLAVQEEREGHIRTVVSLDLNLRLRSE